MLLSRAHPRSWDLSTLMAALDRFLAESEAEELIGRIA
jgi:hypothetical protein